MSNSNHSRIFTGYRALGFVCNHVPLAIRFHKRHKENYVLTCVGKRFHTYNCSKFGIVSVSDEHPEDITCISVSGAKVFTACGNVVSMYKRNKQLEQKFEGHTSKVHLLLPFGAHLISVDANSTVTVWDVAAQEIYEKIYIQMSFDNSVFEITTMIHPSTYLNKILFGSKQGSLQLWNLKSHSLIHRFDGWGVGITVLEQAPAVDTMAIGLADGRIIVHNIKYDETVIRFTQEWGSVTSLTFRTDGPALMLSGSEVGHIAVWDLEERRHKCQIRDAHLGPVTGLQCLPNEPLLCSSSSDNSLKMWIFDMSDGGARLLKQRAGHSAPPSRLRHYGNNGHNILSAGQDSTLQSFSTIHDSNNRSLGRASLDKSYSKRVGLKRDKYMMSPITDFAAESARESDWDNIVAIHRDYALTTTWSYKRFTMGNHKFLHDRFTSGTEYKSAKATCVAITSCGNFTLIGYSSGHIDTYNLQSGLYRGSFGSETAHPRSVRAVVVDGLNQVAVSAGATETTVTFWKFKTKDFLQKVEVKISVNQMVLHRDSGMLAVAGDDFTVRIIDLDTRSVIRIYSGHASSITDMTFSPDVHWLITSSVDCTIRTWHLVTAELVDCFLVDNAVTSLSFSPTGDFLVTSHIDDLGVYLWSNMTLYKYVSLPPLPRDYNPELLELPSTALPEAEINDFPDVQSTMDVCDSEFKSASQISDELVTLSLLPESRWKNLLDLDIIKQRNKPKEPPKASKSAPFFLPTIPGLEMKFNVQTESMTNEKCDATAKFMNISEFGRLLLTASTPQSYIASFQSLSHLGASALDLEIRGLSPEGGGSLELLEKFIECINAMLDNNSQYEFCQSLLGLFLKVHGEILAGDKHLKCKVKQTLEKHVTTWMRLEDMFDQSLCLIMFIRSSTL